MLPDVADGDEAVLEKAADEAVPEEEAKSSTDVASDDVVGQLLHASCVPRRPPFPPPGVDAGDVDVGPLHPAVTPGGLVAGLLSGTIGYRPSEGSPAARLAEVVHGRPLPAPPDPRLAARSAAGSSSSSSAVLPPPPPPLPPRASAGKGKGYGPAVLEPHPDDFAWAFKRGEPPQRFRKDGPYLFLVDVHRTVIVVTF